MCKHSNIFGYLAFSKPPDLYATTSLRSMVKILLFTSFTASQLTACGGGGGVVATTIIPIDVPPVPDAGTYEQQTVINATAAWTAGYKGDGITIAIVDSGVNPDHVDFYDDSGYTRINKTAARGVEYDVGTDTITFTNDYEDIDNPSYHGTHVSSIALGREYGVAPEATLLPVNVFFDNGSAYNTAIFAGVLYSAPQAPIINTSIGGMVNYSTLGTTTELDAYTATLQTYDTALVSAAGNDGLPVGSDHFENNNFERNLAIQAGIENQVLSVINLSDSGVRHASSNYPGSCADVSGSADLACNATIMSNIQNTFISAPGTTITAADGSTSTGATSKTGTSMATPVVSGGLALLMSAWDQLTIQQAVSILKTTADNSFAWYTPDEYGVGLLDINTALGPVGTLKSAAVPAALNPAQSVAILPSNLGGLASLPAFEKVAYFDDFNRDFQIDLSQNIQLANTAIKWSEFWQANNPSIEQRFGNEQSTYQLSLKVTPYQTNQLESLAIQSNKTSVKFNQNSTDDFTVSSLVTSLVTTPQTEPAFYSTKQFDFGNSLFMSHQLYADITLFASLQQQQQKLLNTVANTDIANSANESQTQTLGLSYQFNDKLSLSVSAQLRQEQNRLLDLKGSGVFSFGENNLSQINELSLRYQNNNLQLFSQWQQGQLLDSNQANQSYIEVNKANYGQLKFGVLHTLNSQANWGLQTYNRNRLLTADMSITIPTGMNALGQVEHSQSHYQQKNSWQPDTIELFYQSANNSKKHYQFNMIQSPTDLGIGLQLNAKF